MFDLYNLILPLIDFFIVHFIVTKKVCVTPREREREKKDEMDVGREKGKEREKKKEC